MFDMLKYPKVPKYQLKPLISLKFKNQSIHPHNPKVGGSNSYHQAAEKLLPKQFIEEFLLLRKIHLRPVEIIKIVFRK